MDHAIPSIPDELFTNHIQLHLGFWHLLRLRRVSQSWMALISKQLEPNTDISVPTVDILPHLTSAKALDLRSLGKIPQDYVFPSRISVSLRSLSLGSCTNFNDAKLLQLPNLTSLSLMSASEITDAALACLSKLQTLELSCCNLVTDAGVAALSSLQSLSVQRMPQITTAALSSMYSLTSLQMNYLWADDLVHLTALARLRAGTLSGALSRLSSVRELQFMPAASVRDADLASLTQLVALDLMVPFCLTDRAVQPLTNLRSFGLRLMGREAMTLGCISTLSQLTSLSVSSGYSLTLRPHHVSALSRLQALDIAQVSCEDCVTEALKSLTALRKLEIGFARTAPPMNLSYLTKLRCLRVSAGQGGNVGLECLTNLEELILQSTSSFRGECLPQLSKLTRLSLLDTPMALCKYVSQLTQLQTFQLTQNQRISNQALQHLSYLTSLSIAECPKITTAGISKLKRLRTLHSNIQSDIQELLSCMPELAPH